MKLLQQIQDVSIFDLEQEIIEVEDQLFCFAHHSEVGTKFSRAIKFDLIQNMIEGGEDPSRVERLNNTLSDGEKMGFYKEYVNISRLDKEDWIILHRGQLVKMNGKVFVFCVDRKNNPVLKLK